MNFVKKILNRLSRQNNNIYHAEDLYWQIVAVSRNPNIYKKFAIPDTLDGRFDSLILHLFLVIQRLQSLAYHKIADDLLIFFTNDMDRSLRETGVGDPSIARKMRKIGEAYMGRINAYGTAIKNRHDLYNALHRNIYRHANISEKNITLLTNYVLNYQQLLNHYTPHRHTLPNGLHD